MLVRSFAGWLCLAGKNTYIRAPAFADPIAQPVTGHTYASAWRSRFAHAPFTLYEQPHPRDPLGTVAHTNARQSGSLCRDRGLWFR